MPWMLDPNAWIDYLKHAGSPIRSHLQRHPANEILTCSVVRGELLHGAKKYGEPGRRAALVSEALAPHRSLAFDDLAAIHYAELRHQLELFGQRIGPYDLLIAAISLAHGLTLVTSNVDEFRRVRGLRVEDWLAVTG